MGPYLDQATIAKLRPLDVTHQNSLLYASLKQCMKNNEELRQALVEAAETIDKLTAKLIEQNES